MIPIIVHEFRKPVGWRVAFTLDREGKHLPAEDLLWVYKCMVELHPADHRRFGGTTEEIASDLDKTGVFIWPR